MALRLASGPSRRCVCLETRAPRCVRLAATGLWLLASQAFRTCLLCRQRASFTCRSACTRCARRPEGSTRLAQQTAPTTRCQNRVWTLHCPCATVHEPRHEPRLETPSLVYQLHRLPCKWECVHHAAWQLCWTAPPTLRLPALATAVTTTTTTAFSRCLACRRSACKPRISSTWSSVPLAAWSRLPWPADAQRKTLTASLTPLSSWRPSPSAFTRSSARVTPTPSCPPWTSFGCAACGAACPRTLARMQRRFLASGTPARAPMPTPPPCQDPSTPCVWTPQPTPARGTAVQRTAPCATGKSRAPSQTCAWSLCKLTGSLCAPGTPPRPSANAPTRCRTCRPSATACCRAHAPALTAKRWTRRWRWRPFATCVRAPSWRAPLVRTSHRLDGACRPSKSSTATGAKTTPTAEFASWAAPQRRGSLRASISTNWRASRLDRQPPSRTRSTGTAVAARWTGGRKTASRICKPSARRCVTPPTRTCWVSCRLCANRLAP